MWQEMRVHVHTLWAFEMGDNLPRAVKQWGLICTWGYVVVVVEIYL